MSKPAAPAPGVPSVIAVPEHVRQGARVKRAGLRAAERVIKPLLKSSPPALIERLESLETVSPFVRAKAPEAVKLTFPPLRESEPPPEVLAKVRVELLFTFIDCPLFVFTETETPLTATLFVVMTKGCSGSAVILRTVPLLKICTAGAAMETTEPLPGVALLVRFCELLIVKTPLISLL